MDVFTAIKNRRSIRAYHSKPVPEEVLMRILEAGRLAPSEGNIQPWHFVVVRDAKKREELSKGRLFAGFLRESPVVIVGCGDQQASPRWHVVDVAIAMQNMVLTAKSEGLGTCWIGDFNEEKVKMLLKIPDKMKIIALLSLGFPRKKADLIGKLAKLIRRKKSLKEIVSFEEYE